MRAFEKIKEKYKDGWWEGHDGYSPEEMFNDIEFLIGFGEESLNREASLDTKEEGYWGRLCARQTKKINELEEMFNSSYTRNVQANVRIGELLKEIEELKEELIGVYRQRGDMYMAVEKEWIDNRIEELKG